VQAGLRIVPIRGTRIVHVRFRSPDPDVAAEVANGHARQYIEQSLELRYLASEEATEWLGERLNEERQRVEQSEAVLQTYREQHDVVSLEEGQDIIVQRLADLNAAATRAKTDRIASEAQYRQLMGLQQDRAALDTLPAILANPIIQEIKLDLARLQRDYAQMSETLGERHPSLTEKRSALETTAARLDREMTTVVEAIRNEYRAAVALEDSLTALLEEQKQEALALNRRDIEYGVLMRDAESTRLVYENLLQRANETGVARELRASSIRLIDPAEPPGGPVSPRRGFNLAMALLTGSLLGLGFAFLREHVDDRIKTPDDISTHLGLACLGLIPEVPAKPGQDHPLMTGPVPASFLESVRALRTSVVSRALGGGLESMMVASAEAGEGKSLVAANLAIALAEAGQRVVLIDADLRQPAIHGIFGARSSPGLADVLARSVGLEEVLRATETPGLSLIPAGHPARNAPELLGSPRFQKLLETLRGRFDWAIIDSAPVLTVTDASVVASRTSGVVFVVGAEMTSRRAAGLALERLQQSGGVIVGGLLNRANLERHAFYFAPYSSQEYGSASPVADSRHQGIFGRLASAREA
jgi:capsular exopolysaccharide synthesis family protein